MANLKTAHNVTYDLFRSLGLTALSGNPGLTEETFFQNFPDSPLSAKKGSDHHGQFW